MISRILNHVETGVTAVYNRHSYDAEKRNALERWEKKLLEIVGEGPSDVEPKESEPEPEPKPREPKSNNISEDVPYAMLDMIRKVNR